MNTSQLVLDLKAANEDFEWYPTSERMIQAVKKHLPERCKSIMDIGAGDGRVLSALASKCTMATLYGIEISAILAQAQPDGIIPVGTDFKEQNLSCLEVEYIFSNPPYSEYEAWGEKIITEGYAKHAFLVVPHRWKESKIIAGALARRGATARVIHSDDFSDADRKARAVIEIVDISFPRDGNRFETPKDPFDIWFDQNISTFDHTEEIEPDAEDSSELAKRFRDETIGSMVIAYREEYDRLEGNYRAIFKLDYAILRELGINKEAVRDGIKKKISGLKTKYWRILFARMDAITSRLTTHTRELLLEKLTRNTAVEFTDNNAYAVVLWAIKNANRYYDEQLTQLFRDLSTFEGAQNYKSNRKTWEKDGWRYTAANHSHYALDYRVVVSRYSAIQTDSFQGWDYTGGLHHTAHELLTDIVTVLSNLGFVTHSASSTSREWEAAKWQDWQTPTGDVLFQAKAHKNGNVHLRFMPAAIKRLNVEAGRLLGWLRTKADAVRELGYTQDDVESAWHSQTAILPSSIKLLTSN